MTNYILEELNKARSIFNSPDFIAKMKVVQDLQPSIRQTEEAFRNAEQELKAFRKAEQELKAFSKITPLRIDPDMHSKFKEGLLAVKMKEKKFFYEEPDMEKWKKHI